MSDPYAGPAQVRAASQGHWMAPGQPASLAALRQQGGRVRRVGYGLVLGVGFVVGLLLAVLVTVITVAILV